MHRRMVRFVESVRALRPRLDHLDRQLQKSLINAEQLQQVLINQGATISALNAGKKISSLHEVEFKVFSQWGEDGIIQYLTQNIEIPNKTFIEFGVEHFSESNCRFLMMKDNWSGFVIDGSEANVNAIQSFPNFWRYDLTAHQA